MGTEEGERRRQPQMASRGNSGRIPLGADRRRADVAFAAGAGEDPGHHGESFRAWPIWAITSFCSTRPPTTWSPATTISDFGRRMKRSNSFGASTRHVPSLPRSMPTTLLVSLEQLSQFGVPILFNDSSARFFEGRLEEVGSGKAAGIAERVSRIAALIAPERNSGFRFATRVWQRTSSGKMAKRSLGRKNWMPATRLRKPILRLLEVLLRRSPAARAMPTHAASTPRNCSPGWTLRRGARS